MGNNFSEEFKKILSPKDIINSKKRDYHIKKDSIIDYDNLDINIESDKNNNLTLYGSLLDDKCSNYDNLYIHLAKAEFFNNKIVYKKLKSCKISQDGNYKIDNISNEIPIILLLTNSI